MTLTSEQQSRAAEFQSDVCALTANDLAACTIAEFKGWLSAYATYCELGGVRPPHKPH